MQNPPAGAAPPSRYLAIRVGPYVYKRAETHAEFDQIHELNHATFVREVPQHADPGDARLIDKIHDKNLYLIAKRGERVVGMVAVHDAPPFSVADRLPDPSAISRLCPRPMEVRLLALRPEHRHGPVFVGLMWALYRVAAASDYTHLVIAGASDYLAARGLVQIATMGAVTRDDVRLFFDRVQAWMNRAR